MRTSNKDTDRFFSLRSSARRCLLVALVAPSSAWGIELAPQVSSSAPSSSFDEVATMSAGDGVTCVVTVAGDAKCWGRNDAGQLGRGDHLWVGSEESPGSAAFIDLGGHAQEIHTNGEQTFALLDSGVVRAWGANDALELGLEHSEGIGDDETPADASVDIDVELGRPATQLAVGADFACALLDDGVVRCWGANDVGQLGYGHTRTIGDDEAPAQVEPVALGASAVSLIAGAHHACALLDDGAVRCWGLNDAGQLGYGHTDDIGDDEPPASQSPVSLGGVVVELVAGERHTCARLETGAIRCWGANDEGQLGYGHTKTLGDDESPASAGDVPVGEVATAMAAGARHTCAVMATGSLRCWGEGLDGKLGYGDIETIGDDETPAMVGDVDLGGRMVSSVFIGPTASSTCVRFYDHAVRCWGLGDEGQLGYGGTASLGETATTKPGRIPDIIVVDDSDD